MNYELTPSVLQWSLFRRYGCWQVLTILLAKADEYGRVCVSSEYIEALTGMSHTVVQGVLRTFQEEKIINADRNGALSIGNLPEGVTTGTTTVVDTIQQEVQKAATPPTCLFDINEAEQQTQKKKKPMSYGVQRFKKPTVEEVAAYVREKGFHFDPQYFWDTFETRGWVVGKARTPMKNWRSAANNFEKNELRYNKENNYARPNNYQQQRDEARRLFVGAEQAVAAQPSQTDVITCGVAAAELGIIPG